MPERSTVSRRKAAGFIAGTLAVSAAGAARARPAGAAQADDFIASPGLAGSGHIPRLLVAVRRAPGAGARRKAFANLRQALRAHDAAGAAQTADVARPANRHALYRGPDPGAVLASVIARELDELPIADAAWMSRFSDLETVVLARVRAGG